MDKDANGHIKDDFLKNLIGMQDEEHISDDFTSRVMQSLPKPAVAEVTKRKFNFRTFGIIAVISVAAIFLLINIDFSSIINLASEPSENNPIKYLNFFNSILKSFSDGFSGLKVTSVTVIVLLSGILLYLIDQGLKKWFSHSSVKPASH